MKSIQRHFDRGWFAVILCLSGLGAVTAEDRPQAPAATQGVVANDSHVSVSNIVLTTNQSQQGTTATATVTVLSETGVPVAGARVTGTWSGLTNSKGSGLTNQQGRATFHSARAKDKGVFVFDLGGISAMGAAYDPALNAKSHESIATLGFTDASHLNLGSGASQP